MNTKGPTSIQLSMPSVIDVAELDVPLSEDGELDLSLIDYCLAMTPWERMLANDAALNFADELRASMRHSNEQS